jgi:hypothetical protein
VGGFSARARFKAQAFAETRAERLYNCHQLIDRAIDQQQRS